jgi:hypothetical protein
LAKFTDFINICRPKFWKGRYRKITVALIGFLVILIFSEIGLNLWVRQALRQSLVREPIPDTRLELQTEWLSLGDLLTGQIRKVKMYGFHCQISGVRVQQLQVDCSGLTVDLPVLLKDRLIVLKAISRTRITARITEAAATAYLEAKYPQFKPEITFWPDRLRVIAATEAFGKMVSLHLEGLLHVIQSKTLRFYPQQFRVANHRVASGFLKYIGDRIPLEIEVLKEWPLQIKALSLQKGILVLQIEEMANF